MDKFTQQYLETMLWAENDGDHPLDSKYSVEDISEELKNKAQKDCDEFRKKAGDLLDSLEDTQVAHDFWLTRNGHGAGFWDGDYDKVIGAKLTKICKEMGEVQVYVGDDKKIYFL